MFKRLFVFLSIFLFIGGFFSVNAQGRSNCDMCGFCEGQEANIPADWEQCRQCYYPNANSNPSSYGTIEGFPTPEPNNHYTMIGCVSTDPGVFSSQISSFIFNIIGGIAFLYLLYGVGIVMTSRSTPDRLNYGKRVIYGSIAGLLFVLFSTLIIKFIAVDVLKIPGFGG